VNVTGPNSSPARYPYRYKDKAMETKYGFYAPEDYKKPDWDNVRRVHEWKRYIGSEVQRLWDSFTDKQKAIIASGADEIANQEEWD
jgi:hypothetical protein